MREISLNEIYHHARKFCGSTERKFFGFDESFISITEGTKLAHVDAMSSHLM